MSEENVSPEIEAEAEKVRTMTKRGFDVRERLKGKGLRRGSIVLYLDAEVGEELGDVRRETNALGEETGRVREGVLGEIDALQEKRAKSKVAAERTALDAQIAALTERRDALVERLAETGLTVHLHAVPPVIQKDAHRRAKSTLGIAEKGIPEDKRAEAQAMEIAHLFSDVITSIVDNESGDVNDEITHEDVAALRDLLPPAQWDRLDEAIGRVQFTDAISRNIESQEDFS